MDHDCDLDLLTSLLDEDMSNDEFTEPENGVQSVCELNRTEKSNVLNNNTKSNLLTTLRAEESKSTGPASSDLLAEINRMRERMEKLERELQEKNNSSSTKSPPRQNRTVIDSDNIDLFSSEGKNFVDKKMTNVCSSLKSQQNKMADKKGDSSSLKNEILGDSDSDWEDMDGEKNKLSNAGEELKKLLKKNEHRVAHTPSHNVAQLRAKALPKKGLVQSTLSTMQTTSFTSNIINDSSTVSSQRDKDSSTDPFSGIRITKPLVSSEMMQLRMQGRKMFRLSTLHNKSKKELSDCDWVTIGVIVHKPEPKKSSSGKTYCIWKLNDLQNCDQTVSFFLFGEVYKTHWKVSIGTVVGLLNPSMMDKSEKYQSDIAFTINHPQKLMIMGMSTDLGMCKQVKKNGAPCTNVINKMQGDYCTYHVNAAYKKTCSKRSELNSYTGVTPKSYSNKVLPKGGLFFYQGKSYTSIQIGSSQQKSQVTVKKLQQQQSRMGKDKLSTMCLQQISADDQAKLNKLSDTKQQAFLDLLSTPSLGSMNLVKHLIKQEKYDQKGKGGTNSVLVQSITPTELLKQHKMKMQLKKEISAVSAPVLGRGLQTGLSINLDIVSQPSPKIALTSEKAKQLAILKVQSKGGLQKTNPNAVKKQPHDEKTLEKIKKRVASDLVEEDKNGSKSISSSASSSSPSPSSLAPPAKKSKLLGNVDLNSVEVKKLMNMKSSHIGALTELENEKKEMYFSTLEKKEQYEDKMRSITEMKCTLYSCKLCSYTALSVTDRCLKENHPTTKHQGVKRFFQCRKCKTRRIAFTKIPKDPCSECGEYNFERTSMMREKSGPKLESEQLSIRGDETKFLNSLSYKVTSAVDL